MCPDSKIISELFLFYSVELITISEFVYNKLVAKREAYLLFYFDKVNDLRDILLC